MKKNILTMLLFLGIANMAISQVKEVTYSLKYNAETCLFDCYLNVNVGSTRTVRDRVQLGAQFTIIAPKGSYVKIQESFMPLIGNLELRGDTPAKWDVTSLIENTVSNDAYFSIAPAETPTSFYNDIVEGESLKLFSLDISPKVECASGVRLYENGVDASSSSPGMRGSDFSNGFTMGGIGQKYMGNEATVYPSSPIIEELAIANTNNVDVTAIVSHANKSECQGALSYEWYSPNGLIGSSEVFPKLNRKDLLSGDYKLVVSDEMGCSATKNFKLLDESSEEEEVVLSTDDTKSDIYESSIFPNPSTNVVNLSVKGKVGSRVQASIYDMNGSVINRNVLDEKLSTEEQEFKIETQLKTGIYNIGVYTNNEQKFYHKLIIVE